MEKPKIICYSPKEELGVIRIVKHGRPHYKFINKGEYESIKSSNE